MNINEPISYEETTNRVLSRYSVQDLTEQTPEAMKAASERYGDATDSLVILDQGTVGMIRWWRVKSGERVYEVRRFKNFIYCSCKSFFYRRHEICKHGAVSLGVRCWDCFTLSATGGKLCQSCEAKARLFVPASAPIEVRAI